MKEYYLLGIEHNSIDCCYNLGHYYDKINDSDNMIKYYKIGEMLGCSDCMNNLGVYYKNKENYSLMTYYYTKAISYNNERALFNFGLYYYKIIKDKTTAIQYFIRSSENGGLSANNELVNHYIKEEERNKALTYLIKLIEHPNYLKYYDHIRDHIFAISEYEEDTWLTTFDDIFHELINVYIKRLFHESIIKMLDVLCSEYEYELISTYYEKYKKRYKYFIGAYIRKYNKLTNINVDIFVNIIFDMLKFRQYYVNNIK